MLVGAVALFARLGYLYALTDVQSTPSDASHYHELASNLATGRGYVMHFPQLFDHASAFRPPAYPALLGIWYRVVGVDVVRGKWLNVLIGVGVVILVAALAARLGGQTAGLISGLTAALFPPLIANDVHLLSEPLALALMLGMVLLLLDRRWAPASVLLGVLVLTRPSAPLLVLVVVVWLAATVSRRAALGALAIVAVIVVPWVARNVADVGLADLTSSNGFNLAAVYSSPAQASGGFVDPVYDPRFDDHRLDQFDEAGWARRLRDDGIEGLRSNPGYVARHVAGNVVDTLEVRPAMSEPAEVSDGRNLTARSVGLPMFWLVLAIGTYGLWLLRRDAGGRLLIGIAGATLVANAVFLAPPRLRAPIDVVLLVGVGIGAVALNGAWIARRQRSAGAPASAQVLERAASTRSATSLMMRPSSKSLGV